MLWVALALGSAWLWASADYLIRRYFRHLPLAQVVAARMLGAAVAGAVVVGIVPWPRQVGWGFFVPVALALPMEVTATLLYMRAIQVSELGVSLPWLACTPGFVLLTGWLVLGERPSWTGAAGVVLIVLGAYGLNLHEAGRQGWLGPVKAVARQRGAVMMLGVSALYAFTSVLGKKAIGATSALFVAGAYPLIVGVVLAFILPRMPGWGWQWLRRGWATVGVGVCMGGMLVCHFLAISMAPAAYMLAIKRLSALIGVAYGGVLLGEARAGQHLLATALMLAGAAIVVVWG